MEKTVPRLWYWKFFLRWTMVVGSAGLEEEGSEGLEVGVTVVMEVRMRVGPPQVGQNFLVGSLQSLRVEEGHGRKDEAVSFHSAEQRGTSLSGMGGRSVPEASMTPQHPAPHAPDPPPLSTNEIQPHLQQHVLNREIARHARALHDRPRLALALLLLLGPSASLVVIGEGEAEIAGFVGRDVGGGDPFAGFGRGVFVRVVLIFFVDGRREQDIG
jgi:hypothetical protein